MKRLGFILSFALMTISMAAGTISVVPGSGALSAIIGQAQAGDVLLLTDGQYDESSNIVISTPLTICAAEGAKPVLMAGGRMEVKADLRVAGLSIETHKAAEAFRLQPGEEIYSLYLQGCSIKGFSSKTIRVYATDQAVAYVDSLVIDDCVLRPAAGRGLEASVANKQVQHLLIQNATFDGGASGVGRLIYFNSEEGTTVQSATIDHCTFYNAQDTRGIYLGNIDGAQVSNCIFMNPEYNADYKSYCVYGKNTLLTHSISYNADAYVRSGAQSNNVFTQNPFFVDAANGNFQLYKNSLAATMGADGTTIGDPRWGVSDEEADLSNSPYLPYKMPYSMAPTTTSVKVLWQMAEENEPTTAIVWYGTDKDNLHDSIGKMVIEILFYL